MNYQPNNIEQISPEMFAEEMQHNQQQIGWLKSRLDMHRHLGCHLSIEQWNYVKHIKHAYRVEGVLISVMRYRHMQLFPEGRYECATCGDMHDMDHERKCYASALHGMIVCPSCASPNEDRVLVAYLNLVGAFDLQTMDCVSIIDQTLSEEELTALDDEKKKHLEKLKTMMSSEFIYLDNKRITDIRAEFLAKRVLRQWRIFMRNRLRARLFKVLYFCADMDMNASVVLSKNPVIKLL